MSFAFHEPACPTSSSRSRRAANACSAPPRLLRPEVTGCASPTGAPAHASWCSGPSPRVLRSTPALSETLHELGLAAEIDESGRYDSVRT